VEEDWTNVTRHADAAGCTVTITCDQAPTVDVRTNPDRADLLRPGPKLAAAPALISQGHGLPTRRSLA
jgi:hypothetical protein